jgi:hypothetical protein
METLLTFGSNGTFNMSDVCKVLHLELGCGSSGTFDVSDVSDFCKGLQLELSFLSVLGDQLWLAIFKRK